MALLERTGPVAVDHRDQRARRRRQERKQRDGEQRARAAGARMSA